MSRSDINLESNQPHVYQYPSLRSWVLPCSSSRSCCFNRLERHSFEAAYYHILSPRIEIRCSKGRYAWRNPAAEWIAGTSHLGLLQPPMTPNGSPLMWILIVRGKAMGDGFGIEWGSGPETCIFLNAEECFQTTGRSQYWSFVP